VSGCAVCGGPIEQPQTGRRRVTCSHACKQEAYRRRRVAWPADFELAEDALVSLVVAGVEAPELALERIVHAWRVAA
jgi:predicted nucleic acid-binding Zn ribbon protein